MKKNFYYRIEPQAVLSEIADIPHSKQREKWFMQFFKDLIADDPVTAKTDFTANIILEAKAYRQKKANSGPDMIRIPIITKTLTI